MLLSVTGSTSIHGIPIPLDRDAIAQIIPKTLFLPSYEDSSLLFTIGRQISVRPEFWLLPGESYHEAIFGISGLRLHRDPEAGPFMYWPLLYVDRLLPDIIGNSLGFHKKMTRWIVREDETTVIDRHTGATLITARFDDDDRDYPNKKFPTVPVLSERQVISMHSGYELQTRFFDDPNFRVTPSRVKLEFAEGLLPGLPKYVDSAKVTPTKNGSFRTVQKYKLDPPHQIARVKLTKEKKHKKQKVVILGGGVGAITTALELTSDPDWKKNYDVTLYQMGWRLGGKGASGRNAEYGQRIEEHGLHVWAGFYDHAFDVFKQCYEELKKADLMDGVFPSWRDAFEVQNKISMQEYVNGKWYTNTGVWPTNDKEPGTGSGRLTEADYLHMLMEFLVGHSANSQNPLHNKSAEAPDALLDLLDSANDWLSTTDHLEEFSAPDTSGIAEGMLEGIEESVPDIARRLFARARTLGGGKEQERILGWVSDALTGYQAHLSDELEQDDVGEFDPEQFAWHAIMDIGLTSMRAMLAEGVLFRGLQTLDKYDLRELLEKYGAHPLALHSSLVRGGYDYVFGFENGDLRRPGLAAGVAIRGALRVFLAYKGSILWKMRAGMGDTLFTPFYKVLKHRGVKFKFFHRVTEVIADNGEVSTIKISQQAQLKKGVKEYDPFVRVGNLDCWPDRPKYAQLQKGKKLRNANVNLESFWNPWQFSGQEESITLRAGKDFDSVVLGISVGAFPHLCKSLNSNKKWKRMVKRTATVQTMAMQLWSLPDLQGLGWKGGSTIATAYAERFSTWADMSHLLEEEAWQTPEPENIAYFCGVLEDASTIPPSDQTDFPKQQYERVKKAGARWLDRYIEHLWPDATSDGGFDRSVLRTEPDSNISPMAQQFFRANIDPSERYVLSLPGTVKDRLPAGGSGFRNLFLAGDWVDTSVNAGCVEAAVLSGMDAASALNQRTYAANESVKIVWPPRISTPRMPDVLSDILDKG